MLVTIRSRIFSVDFHYHCVIYCLYLVIQVYVQYVEQRLQRIKAFVCMSVTRLLGLKKMNWLS